MGTWWRHQMKTFSALLAICAGNSPVPGEFPSQRPVTRSFDVFFDMHLNKRLSKQSWGWWFETLSSPLWCHSNEAITLRISRFTSGTGGCRYGNLWCQQWQQNWHHDDPPVSVWALTQEPEKRHSVCEIRKTILSVHCHMEYGFKVKWVRDPCFHLKYMWIYYLFTGCFQNGFVVSTVALDIYIYIFIYIYIYIYISIGLKRVSFGMPEFNIDVI